MRYTSESANQNLAEVMEKRSKNASTIEAKSLKFDHRTRRLYEMFSSQTIVNAARLRSKDSMVVEEDQAIKWNRKVRNMN